MKLVTFPYDRPRTIALLDDFHISPFTHHMCRAARVNTLPLPFSSLPFFLSFTSGLFHSSVSSGASQCPGHRPRPLSAFCYIGEAASLSAASPSLPSHSSLPLARETLILLITEITAKR